MGYTSFLLLVSPAASEPPMCWVPHSRCALPRGAWWRRQAFPPPKRDSCGLRGWSKALSARLLISVEERGPW